MRARDAGLRGLEDDARISQALREPGAAPLVHQVYGVAALSFESEHPESIGAPQLRVPQIKQLGQLLVVLHEPDDDADVLRRSHRGLDGHAFRAAHVFFQLFCIKARERERVDNHAPGKGPPFKSRRLAAPDVRAAARGHVLDPRDFGKNALQVP